MNLKEMQLMIKKLFRALPLVFLLFGPISALCGADQPSALPKIDYTNPANWALYTPSDKTVKPFDVFYLYPTLYASRETPLMPWDDAVKAKVIPFARAQTAGLAEHANLFSPYVRQLEFYRCIGILKNERQGDLLDLPLEQSAAPGIADAIEAFQYYLTHLNHGRPYIILAHSQGSMEMAVALSMNGNVGVDRGFVAAYLPGVPLRPDGGLKLAKGEEDIGVVISWNSQAKGAKNLLFGGKGTYCINPLNWKTDATPAGKEVNSAAVFYDYRTGKTAREKNYCGAFVDLENGALVVTGLPEKSPYLEDTLLGKGVYHANDLYFFYENLVANMRKRVAAWQKQYGRKN